MTFWRPDIQRTEPLQWCERVGIAVWWLGRAAFVASAIVSAAIVGVATYSPLPGMPTATVLQSTLAMALAGTVALIGARLILAWAINVSETRGP